MLYSNIEFVKNYNYKNMPNCILIRVFSDSTGEKYLYFYSYDTAMWRFDYNTRSLEVLSTYRSNTTSRQMNRAFEQVGIEYNARKFYKNNVNDVIVFK